MKKLLSVVLSLSLLLALFAGCAAGEEKQVLTVFAAASLEETLTKLGEAYMAEHKDVYVVFDFDSSGTLKTQIEEGAECDVFISAGQKQMNELNCLLEDSRFDLLENKVALVVPEGNPANINSYEDLAAALKKGTVLLAIGNSDVPVGQYTRKIFSYFGISEDECTACLTYGSNVKEITTQVKENVVDCGMIYQTDAFSAGLTVVATATAEMCGQVIYPAAVMEGTEDAETAQDFLEYLTRDAADEIFASVGFTPIA